MSHTLETGYHQGLRRSETISMPRFNCTVCDVEFEVPQAALDKFPGWKPNYCREHSPKKKRTASAAAKPGRRTSKLQSQVTS